MIKMTKKKIKFNDGEKNKILSVSGFICGHDFVEEMSILEFRSCEVNQLDDRLKKLNMLKKEAKLLIDNIEHGQHQHYLPS